jgi:hypothetical protein
MGVLAATVAVALAVAVTGSAAPLRAHAGVFTGYGFDACTAPSSAALGAWTASPYRSLGIYLGGVNRACADGNLNSTWVSTTLASGWSLLPLYVGLQAPCVGKAKLARISTNVLTASTQGRAAADDAIGRADTFGLPAGSPIYFDMEGYALNNAGCTKSVQSFVAAWVNELRGRGYVAGVYGSAASTIRDIAVLGSSIPDAAWIANWNGNESVFGDPHVSDALWANHQRVHQYKGGHKETWGGVTINIDNNYVDGPVVGGSAPAPPPPPPPAGSVGSGDNRAIATWPDGAFLTPVAVTLTPVNPPPANGYGVQLTVTDTQTATPVTRFGAAVTVHIANPDRLMPSWSVDGITWTPLPKLAPGVDAGYTLEPTGDVDVQTFVPAFFGLLPDTVAPARVEGVAARFVKGSLRLNWAAASDNSGSVASYDVLFDGSPVASTPGGTRRAIVHAFHPATQTVYRVRAVDAAGNAGVASRPIVVQPTKRPKDLPRALPRWAWDTYTAQRNGRERPAAAPKKLPAWYWSWAAWRAAPFHLRR